MFYQKRTATAQMLKRSLSMLCGLAILISLQAHGEDAPAPYRIVDGKVDRNTYLGWRVFNSACHICHGVDATGTVVAPNLVQRVKDMDSQRFATAVLQRYVITLYSGQIADNQTALREGFIELVIKREQGELIMPTWDRDPNVKPHIMDLYAYLRARADGHLGDGRPVQIEE